MTPKVIKILLSKRCVIFITPILTAVILICNATSSWSRGFESPIQRSLGGTGRGSIDSHQGPFLNPAVLSFLDKYHIGSYIKGTQNEVLGLNQELVGYLMENGDDKLFAGGAFYGKRLTSISGARTHFTHLEAFISKLFYDGFSIGFGARWVQEKTDSSQPTRKINGEIGFIFSPYKFLSTGLVIKNPFNSWSSAVQPLVGWGVTGHYLNIISMNFDIEAQLRNNPNKNITYMTGFTSHLPAGIDLRFGYRWDNLVSINSWSTGLGWIGPKISLHYVYENAGGSLPETTHGVDLSIFF